ncbi:hypothetical protein [Streptomyces sp. Inha503]|uniref:hypothetical protein n=1 Tax=Streptomyces sp. Inha503 TaxID=3383314 RepID=UPI0039A35920
MPLRQVQQHCGALAEELHDRRSTATRIVDCCTLGGRTTPAVSRASPGGSLPRRILDGITHP